MSRPRFFSLAGALWELTRFSLLYALVLWQAEGSNLSMVRILWFGSAQLALIPAFILLAWDPIRYSQYIRLIAAAKIVSLVPGIGLTVILVRSLGLFVEPVHFIRFYFPVFASFAILAIDVIFLLILIRWGSGGGAEQPDTDSSLPEYHETEVKDI